MPVTYDGQTQTASVSLSAAVTVSGTINVGKSDLGASISVGVSVTSQSLRKGQYLDGYYKTCGYYYQVLQRQYMVYNSSTYVPTNNTAIAYVFLYQLHVQ